MQYYIGIFIFLLVIFGYIFFLKDKYEYNFGKSLFLSVALIAFFMSVFSLLNIMIIGFWTVTIFGILYLIYSIINNYINKNSLFKFLCCPSFLFFLLFLLIFTLCANKATSLMNWDECSYWGTITKRLFYFNSYIGGDQFHTMYYPPALTSLNYYVVKFLGISDSSIYFAQYFSIFSGAIFIVRNIKWKNILFGIGGLIGVFLFLILLLKPFILTLYSEIPLIMFLTAAIILLVTAKKKIDYIFVSILLFNVTLIKSNGIVACIIVMLIALGQIIYQVFNNNKIKYEKNIFKNIFEELLKYKYLVLVIISPILAKISFDIYLNLNNISNPQSMGAGLKDFILTLITSTPNDTITTKFFDALSFNYNYSFFNISSILLLSLFIIGFIVLKKIYDNKSEIINKNKYIETAYFLGFVIYAAALLYSYCFLFSRFEANMLASFDRYINTFIGASGLALIGIVLYMGFPQNRVISKKMCTYMIVLLLVLFTVVKISDVGLFVKQLLPSTGISTVSQITNGQEIANKYKNRFTKNDKIHLIIQKDYGLTVWSLIYYMTPLKLYDPRFDGDCWSIRQPYSDNVENTTIMSSDKYIKFLTKEKFTHVLVVESDIQFSEQYKDIFQVDNNNYIKEGIYKFNKKDKKLIFEKEE